MSRFLILDIGAGTMDILYYDSALKMHYKAVVKSPILYLAEKIKNIHGNIFISGSEMGGGMISEILRKRATEYEAIMTKSASATVHHDPERVKSLGIRVVDDEQEMDLKHDTGYAHLQIGDLEIGRLSDIIGGMGIPFSFDVIGVCAQDHGIPPPGMSHLDYRHHIFKENLDKTPFPHALLYKADEVPETMNRLRSIANDAKKIPADEIYVMDSGMAAILGASMDPTALKKERLLTLDIATSHTIAAAIDKGELAGFFEYHTRDITLVGLESLLVELADGKLVHKKVLQEGGHGAYIRKAFGFESVDSIVATGPKRHLIRNSKIPILWGVPLGDNMMTGTVGVLEAIRRRNGLEPFLTGN
jgi:uncharacterized protein (DUF1786 family)